MAKPKKQRCFATIKMQPAILFVLLLLAAPGAARAAIEPEDAAPKSLPFAPPVSTPIGLPHTERRGDDLIIHFQKGDDGLTLKGYMKGPGMTSVEIEVDGHGKCALALDPASGATLGARCDQ